LLVVIEQNERRIWAPRANPRNLKGFFDAFKAVLRLRSGSGRRNPLSLTHCEDFA